MDLNHFLSERLKFVKYFYINSSQGFNVIINSIDNQESPYEPYYDESGEPQYLTEWLDAQTGKQSVGMATLSMYSSSLNLFLNSWVSQFENEEKKYPRKHKKGWWNAYKLAIKEIGVVWSDCPANLELIEQAILARNRGQHSEQLTTLNISHSKSDLGKYPSPYFVSEDDENRLKDLESSWWSEPQVHIDEEKLDKLLNETMLLSKWLSDLEKKA